MWCANNFLLPRNILFTTPSHYYFRIFGQIPYNILEHVRFSPHRILSFLKMRKVVKGVHLASTWWWRKRVRLYWIVFQEKHSSKVSCCGKVKWGSAFELGVIILKDFICNSFYFSNTRCVLWQLFGYFIVSLRIWKLLFIKWRSSQFFIIFFFTNLKIDEKHAKNIAAGGARTHIS